MFISEREVQLKILVTLKDIFIKGMVLQKDAYYSTSHIHNRIVIDNGWYPSHGN